MEKKVFVTKDGKKTQELGKEFSKEIKSGDIISLTGNLGAGKTTFTQGVAVGLGIKSRIISPTFVLVRQHVIKGMTLYHIDLYRIENEKELKSLGIEEMLEDKNGVFIVEWAEKHPSLRSDWEIRFEDLGNTQRKIEIASFRSQ